MIYSVLSLSLVTIWAVSFLLLDRDLLSPGAIVPLMMLVASIFATVGLSSWNSIQIGYICYLIVTLSTLAFSLGSILVTLAPFNRRRVRPLISNKTTIHLSISNITTRRVTILLAVAFVLLVMHYLEMRNIAVRSGFEYSSISELSRWIRNRTSPVTTTEGITLEGGFSFFDRQLSKVSIVLGFIAAFLLPTLFVQRVDRTLLLSDIVLLALSCYRVILTGNRGLLLSYVLCGFISYFIVIREYCKVDNRKLARAICSVGIVLMIVSALLFYVLSGVVGRPASTPLVEYMTFYYGCGIPSLQVMLQTGHVSFPLPFFNTFHEQYAFLYKLHLVGQFAPYGSVFVNLNGMKSNVFTFAYRYYSDFGLVGTFVLSLISGAIYTHLYERCKEENASVAYRALYCMISVQLFDFARDEKLFAALLSVNYMIRYLVLICIITWLLLPGDWLKTVKTVSLGVLRHE